MGPVTRHPFSRRSRPALANRRDHSSHLPPATGYRLKHFPGAALGPVQAETLTTDSLGTCRIKFNRYFTPGHPLSCPVTAAIRHDARLHRPFSTELYYRETLPDLIIRDVQ